MIMAQVSVQTCSNHNEIIDMFCEDCDEFLCCACAKDDHRDHKWVTLVKASTERRRELPGFLSYIKKDKLSDIDREIKKTSEQIEKNENQCESQIGILLAHYYEIIARLSEVMRHHEKKIKDNLAKKNQQAEVFKSHLLEKRKLIAEKVEFLEEYCTLSKYSLIHHHKELKQMLSDTDIDIKDLQLSMIYREGKINDEDLEQMIGQTLNLDDISATQSGEFQYGRDGISVLEALSTDECYLKLYESDYIEQVDKRGEMKQKFKVYPSDICVAADGHAYITDGGSNSISCLSSVGSCSTVFSTHPLVPLGICQSLDGRGGLLITLREELNENESDRYYLNFQSRRLLKRISLMGDVMHEIEYEEDGQTKLFTWPWRVTQNKYAETCVVNQKSSTSGELVIFGANGRKKSVYGGQIENFTPYDVIYDTRCNILVTDRNNHCVHVLSRQGEFFRYLLTEKEVNSPMSLSLYKSSHWLGESKGVVRVFNYKSVSWCS